uniref:PPIase cyclophilin-type domain-containing protein n=1 Tax=Ditylum brightwellii TaxID=49249 RepID=A0A7S4S3K6_9STRA
MEGSDGAIKSNALTMHINEAELEKESRMMRGELSDMDIRDMMKKGSLHFEPRHRRISRKSEGKEKGTKEGHAKHHKDLLRHQHQMHNQPEEALETIEMPEADAAQTGEGQCLPSLQHLTEAERRPAKSPRHFNLQPPPPTQDSPPLTLVCCHTSNGALSLAVHPSWAPIGAKHFLDLVRDDYFKTDTPFFRTSTDKKSVTFGLTSDVEKSAQYLYKTIPDDPQWLPQNQTDPHQRLTRRGYVSFAGNGPNTRAAIFVLALQNTAFADTVPDTQVSWLVPFAELVGFESYRTMDSFYTGYDHGPSPSLLLRHGFNNYAKKKYPKMGFIKECHVMDDKDTNDNNIT